MKNLIIIAFILMSFVGFSQEPYTTMTSYVNTNVVNNSTNSITGFKLNKAYNDILISMGNPYYDVTRPYTEDTSVVIFSDILYRCIIDNSAGAFNSSHWKAIAFADADSIIIENMSAFTDTITVDSPTVFHDPVAMGTGISTLTDGALNITSTGDVMMKAEGSSDTTILIKNTGTAANTNGIYSTITGGTNSSIALEGHAVTTVKTIPVNSYAGVYGQSGSSTLHNYGVIGTTITSSIGDNVAGYFNTLNGGAGDAFVLRLVDGNTNTNKLLRTDASGNMIWGIIQDDGSKIGIGIAPISSIKVAVSGNHGGIGYWTTSTGSNAINVSYQGLSSGATASNIGGLFSASNSSLGVANGDYGIACNAKNTGGLSTAGYFEVITSNTGDNIGITSVVVNGTGNAYVARFDVTGTDMTGKIPVSIDANGLMEMQAKESYFATASEVAGTGDVITIDFTPNVVVFTGLTITYVSEASNTGATTINIDGAGAVNIFEASDISTLEANDIRSTMMVEIVYDGTQWQQISQSGN